MDYNKIFLLDIYINNKELALLESMSKEQKEYIRKYKLNKFIIFGIQFFIISFFLIIWEFLSRRNIINAFIFHQRVIGASA